MQRSGEQEVFAGGGGSRTMVEYMEARWLGGEVVSSRGHCCCWIILFGGLGETRSYKTVSLPKPRERRALSVAVTEAKEVSSAQNCEGSKMRIDDK